MKFIIFLVLALISMKALAMEVSCNSDEIYFKISDIVFVGTVIRKKPIKNETNGVCWTIEQGEQCGSKIATFEVEETLKGNASNITSIFASDGCYCVSPYFDIGEKYIVFAQADGSRAAYSSLNTCATQVHKESRLNQLRIIQQENYKTKH